MQPGDAALQLVAQFDRGFERWQATSRQVLQLLDEDPVAASQLSFGDSEAQFESMRDAIDKLGELEDQAASAEGAAAVAQGKQLATEQLIVIGVGLLLCLVLIIIFPRFVTRPLEILLDRLEQIAEGDGDLHDWMCSPRMSWVAWGMPSTVF